jgi:hypothetical protein
MESLVTSQKFFAEVCSEGYQTLRIFIQTGLIIVEVCIELFKTLPEDHNNSGKIRGVSDTAEI